MKFLVAIAVLVTAQISFAETIVCTGVVLTGGNRVDIARDHAPIEIDIAPNAPQQYQNATSFMGRKIVLENGALKVTAARSVNDTQEIVLDVWNGRTRANWASGANVVSLGYANNTPTERNYGNVTCYTTPTWQARNARTCPNNTAIPDSVREYCDRLLENKARNFPEGY